MKRFFLFLLIAMMTLTLFACDNGASGNTYTGSMQGTDLKLVLNGNKGTLTMTTVWEVEEDTLAAYELEGALTRSSIAEVDFSAEVKGDTVTLVAEPLVTKTRMGFSGSAAEGYIEVMKKQYAEYLENEYMSQEDYDDQIALIDGATVTRTQEMKYEFVMRLDRKNGTMLVKSNVMYDSEGALLSRSQYDYDGTTLVRETSTSENSQSVTEFYPNGERKTVSDFEDGLPSSYAEYYENGETKSMTYFEDGKRSQYVQYYENGERKYSVSYDEDGNIEYETHYDENGERVE